jgi:hypothetical protein
VEKRSRAWLENLIRGTPLLVMQPKENDHAKDDGGEQDLSDMVVEDLLVGVGGVAEACLLLSQRFIAGDGTQCLGYVLFYVHVLDSLGDSAEISLRSQCCSWGVPLFQGQGCL